jgi:hypothetical protein
VKFLLSIILLLAAAVQIYAGPAPYSSAKIYIIASGIGMTDASGKTRGLNPQEIRDTATIKIEINPIAIVPWFYSLHWEQATYDPTVRQWAKPIVMIIDLYDRVQPEPPGKPTFDTLYCTTKYAYSKEGYYISIAPFTSESIKLPVIKSP